MSSQRVIQDSDDEDGDILSDVASSCDPLQDSSYAPKETSVIERVQDNHPAIQIQVSAQPQFSASELPQVDFDRFLRSESSIMAGDYEDERWVSTAHSNPGNVIPFGNFHTEQMHLQDNSFRYTVKAPHNTIGSLPPTSNIDYDHDTVIATELDHPSKRRKISNSNTQDTLLKEPEESGSSYNFFASIDPNGPPQTAASLPPVPIMEGMDGIPQDVETEPLPMGSLPPTIPFSEDPVLLEQEVVVAEAVAIDFEVQETIIQQPPSETDNEVSSTKKKRGRPKKQDTSEIADSEPKIIVESVPEITGQQSTKKKPGRPKKPEMDTTVDQLPTIEQKEAIDETNSTRTAAKPSKKKVKRSKTTSDIPNTKSEELKAEQDVVWIETNPTDLATTDGTTNTTEYITPAEDVKVPKKRGRKKKEVVEEPAASENQTILQDISNIQQAPRQEKQKDIEVEINVAEQRAPLDEGDTSNATNLPETPTVEIQSKDSNPTEGGGGAATPTPQERNNSVKQTLISSAGKVPFRVGLSRKARIAPLLKVVRK